MSKTHFLKIDKKYFDRVLDGSKTFEIRLNDRDFQTGDIIIFDDGLPSSQDCQFSITYVLHFPQGLKEGYVGLAIKQLPLFIKEQ